MTFSSKCILKQKKTLFWIKCLELKKKVKIATTIPANCTFAHFDCQNTEGISVRWNKYLARYKNMLDLSLQIQINSWH